MAQLSDDCFAHGGRLTPLDEALDLLRDRLVAVTAVETAPLAACTGRILAEDVISDRAVPPHDNSAVDGYAVHFDDLDPDRETELPVAGRLAAGEAPTGPATRGTVIRIFTGAPMPAGADTVMMQEDCVEADGRVRIPPGIKRGANRRFAGEDVEAGATILTRGQLLRPQDVGLAASIGRAALPVHAPLKVALFSTGDERRAPGEPTPPGTVYDANRYALAALLRGLGCRVTDLGILRDDQAAIARALGTAAAGHDLVLTSGGVSVGEEDHVRAAVEAQGALHVWRLAIKPGRPVALGQIGATPFLGLPGNPVAVMVTFLRFARPLILRLMGAADPAPVLFRVRAGFDHTKKADRREWVRARLSPGDDGVPVATKFPRQGAGILSSMVAADGLVELPEALTYLERGMMVEFLPFSEVGA
jgi:molybdopterin molybdotransferase